MLEWVAQYVQLCIHVKEYKKSSQASKPIFPLYFKYLDLKFKVSWYVTYKLLKHRRAAENNGWQQRENAEVTVFIYTLTELATLF
jgi:hypothetical protein